MSYMCTDHFRIGKQSVVSDNMMRSNESVSNTRHSYHMTIVSAINVNTVSNCTLFMPSSWHVSWVAPEAGSAGWQEHGTRLQRDVSVTESYPSSLAFPSHRSHGYIHIQTNTVHCHSASPQQYTSSIMTS